MREEIIIETEKVLVSELNARERQIYEFGYKKGREQATERNLAGRAMIFFGFVLLAFLSFFIYKSIEAR